MMTKIVDYRKVTKALECCRELDCYKCPYFEHGPEPCKIYDDTLTLIKAQREELRQLQRSRNWAPKEDRHDQV